MKVRTPDDRVLQGTPVQIIKQMRDLSAHRNQSVFEYAEQISHNLARYGGPPLDLQKLEHDNTEEPFCEALVEELVSIGQLEKL